MGLHDAFRDSTGTANLSIERYWKETNMSPRELDKLIQDNSCYSSERYFLSCVNAMLSAAEKNQLVFTLDAKLRPEKSNEKKDMTERELLTPWVNAYRGQRPTVLNIKFKRIWDSLLQKTEASRRPYISAVAMNGFISVFKDPHTYLVPVDYYNEVIAQADNKGANLGMILSKTEGRHFVRKVVEGSAAQLAGLKKGDVLIRINKKSVVNQSFTYIGSLLKGEIQTVLLEVERAGEIIRVDIQRSDNPVPVVSYRKLAGKRTLAYMAINKFSKQSCARVKEAISEANIDRTEGMLLDLRDNSGGQIEEAACIIGLFVGEGKRIFDLKFTDTSKSSEIYFSKESRIYEKPLAILINRGTASASEILAGSLRDLGYAILVGEASYGKGSFQEGESWKGNSSVALFSTKGYYILPSGLSPQGHGLQPDITVSSGVDDQVRESEQYMFPLSAPKFKPKVFAKTKLIMGKIPSDCGSAKGFIDEDPFIQGAQKTLACGSFIKRAASVSLGNDPN